MATIDPNIALGYQPVKIENPINQYAAMSQIEAGQQANQLNALKMQEYERGLGEENKLRTLLGSGINLDSPEAIRQVYSISPKLGGEFEKNRQAIKKDATDSEKTQTETTQKKLDLIRQKTSDLQFNPSNENIIAHAQDGVLNNAWSQEQANQFVAKSIAIPMVDRPKQFALQGLDAEKRVTSQETSRHNLQNEKVASGNLAVNQGQLAIAQNKANREQTMGTIPAGYRLSKDGATLEAMPGGPTTVALPPKEIQKREAVLPQAKLAVKIVSNTMSVIGDTVDNLLKNEKGINGITGLVYGNTLAITDEARKAEADLETLKNLAFVQGITELRNASKTGAGVGNVTNREGDRFENLKASLNRSQSKEDLINSLKKLKQQAQLTSQFTNEAFDETYSYKNNAEPMQPSPVNSAAPVSPTEKKPSLKEIFTAPIKQQ